MVKTKKDLTGQIFGRLTVIEQAEDYIDNKGKRYAMWLCECNCEERTKVKVSGTRLNNNVVLSCGCIRKEQLIKMNRSRSKTNNYSQLCTDEYGDYYVGFTSNTNNEFYVDADDFDKVANYCWNEHIYVASGYRRLETRIDNKIVSMSEIIDCKYYDHEDRNPLNNRRYNLRQANQQENCRNHSKSSINTSGVIGVGWHKASNKWQSRIYINKKAVFLGYFANKDDAIKARLYAEVKYFGEFAPQKHLYEQYGIIMEDKNDGS